MDMAYFCDYDKRADKKSFSQKSSNQVIRSYDACFEYTRLMNNNYFNQKLLETLLFVPKRFERRVSRFLYDTKQSPSDLLKPGYQI